MNAEGGRSHALQRILAEQRRCRDLLLSGECSVSDLDGMRAGLADWVMEEVLVREEMA